MKTTVRNVLVCVVLFLPITARSSDDVLDVAVEREFRLRMAESYRVILEQAAWPQNIQKESRLYGILKSSEKRISKKYGDERSTPTESLQADVRSALANRISKSLDVAQRTWRDACINIEKGPKDETEDSKQKQYIEVFIAQELKSELAKHLKELSLEDD